MVAVCLPAFGRPTSPPRDTGDLGDCQPSSAFHQEPPLSVSTGGKTKWGGPSTGTGHQQGLTGAWTKEGRGSISTQGTQGDALPLTPVSAPI